jgi:hypothetical protein
MEVAKWSRYTGRLGTDLRSSLLSSRAPWERRRGYNGSSCRVTRIRECLCIPAVGRDRRSLRCPSQTVYHVHPLTKLTLETLVCAISLAACFINLLMFPTNVKVGRGVIWADGETHRRQRKAIDPGFTSVKIREYTAIFYDCAHKVRESRDSPGHRLILRHLQLAFEWDTQLDIAENCVIDVSRALSAFAWVPVPS